MQRGLNWVRISALSGALLLTSILFQNCTSQGNDVRFRDSQLKNSGNGQPYEGKPDPGDYYRVVPGFTCSGDVPSVAGSLHVTASSVKAVSISAQDCSRSETLLDFPDVETSPFNKNLAGFKDGIYERAQTPPDPQTDAAETWCRSDFLGAPGFDVSVKVDPQGGGLQATVVASNGSTSKFQPVREVKGYEANYRGPNFTLTLTLGSGDKHRATLNASTTNGTVSGGASCRTVVRPATSGGLFVLSADATAGNFGGLQGANSFCLNQLTSYDFKGKSTLSVRPDNVFAFLCDSSTCNNLPAGQIFSYARAGDSSIGGLSFQTNSVGSGPGDLLGWDDPGAFGPSTDVRAWTNRSGEPSAGTHWDVTPAGSHCSDWTTTNPSQVGMVGAMNVWNNGRWDNGGNICSDRNRLICVVLAN